MAGNGCQVGKPATPLLVHDVAGHLEGRDVVGKKKLDAAIDALVDALAELPEHELEGWQRGNRLGLRIICELGRRYPGIVQATGPVRRNSA